MGALANGIKVVKFGHTPERVGIPENSELKISVAGNKVRICFDDALRPNFTTSKRNIFGATLSTKIPVFRRSFAYSLRKSDGELVWGPRLHDKENHKSRTHKLQSLTGDEIQKLRDAIRAVEKVIPEHFSLIQQTLLHKRLRQIGVHLSLPGVSPDPVPARTM